ncbi:MAG: polysaccharide pyruvyl transferase family protein, partial [Saprospiraceae bacterium]
IEALTERYPSSQFTVLCSQLELCRKYLPDINFASDLEFVTNEAEWKEVVTLYQEADIVISAPGGFIHDFYEIEDRLRGFEVALDLGKPIMIFGQSMGPFWKPASLKRVSHVMNRITSICVRDTISIKYLLDCGVAQSRISQTADAAFLWRHLAPAEFHLKAGPVKTIGLCFRVWPLGDTTGVIETVRKAKQLCIKLLIEEDRQLVFISTCQGVNGYIDDSLLALQVVEQLPFSLRSRCKIDRERRNPRSLMNAFGMCDAFIGMRLHGCIMAMLGGTPAMGLGYEHKTEEIFNQLGFGQYQVGFEKELDQWMECSNRFLNQITEIRLMLPKALDDINEMAQFNVKEVELCLRVPKSAKTEIQFKMPEYFGALARKLWNNEMETLLEKVKEIIPEGKAFIFVDDGQFGKAVFPNHKVIPFLEREGNYWGAPPDDETAINELKRMLANNYRFIVFAWPAFWWLDYYKEWHQSLRNRFQCVIETDRVLVFNLRQQFAVQDEN